MRWMRAFLLALPLTLAASPMVHAEEAPGSLSDAPIRAADGHRHKDQKRRQQIRRKIEVIRIVRLTDELDLDAETAARVVPLFKRFDKLEQDHRRARRQAMDNLRGLVEQEPVDDAAVNHMLNSFFDVEEAHVKQRRELFQDLDGVLSVEQQARFVLFVPRFQQEMRTIARDLARDRQGGRGHDRRRHDRSWQHGDRFPGREPGRPPEDWLAEPEMDR